jgi:hypothetical protein
LFIRQVAINIEEKADITKPNRGLLFDTERPFEIKITFGSDTGILDIQFERRRHRIERYASTSDQCLKKHVTGTGMQPCPASCWMQARLHERATSFYRAGNAFANRSLGSESDNRSVGIVTVTRLYWFLKFFEFRSVHAEIPP